MSGSRDRPLRARWRSLAFDPDSTLSTSARAAAAAYAEHSVDAHGVLSYPPSAQTLADWMGCAERTARAARRELVAAGLLELEHRPGGTAGVRLTFPTPAKSAAPTPATTPATTPAKSAAGTRGTRRTRSTTSGGAHSRARTDGPARAGGRAEHGDAQRLVADHVNRLRELGATPTKRVVGQVARQIGELVADGVEASTIAAALELMVERRLHPTALGSLVTEAELGPRRSAADTRADEWKEARNVYDRA